MLDKPSLDFVAEVLIVVKELEKEGYTILLVEQNVRLSLKISNRSYVLEKGRIVLEGSSAEIAENPHVKQAYLGL